MFEEVGTAFIVGKPMPQTLRGQMGASEGGRLLLTREDQMFIVGAPNIKPAEQELAATAPIELGLFPFGDALFIMMKAGFLELDFSYNFSVGEDDDLRGIAPIPYEAGYGFSLIVFDTFSGLVSAIRYFSVTPAFSEELHFQIEKARERHGAGKYNFKYWYDKAMKKYPNPNMMWKDCVIVEIAGHDFSK